MKIDTKKEPARVGARTGSRDELSDNISMDKYTPKLSGCQAFIKPSYKFTEINELQKRPLSDKIAISTGKQWAIEICVRRYK